MVRALFIRKPYQVLWPLVRSASRVLSEQGPKPIPLMQSAQHPEAPTSGTPFRAGYLLSFETRDDLCVCGRCVWRSTNQGRFHGFPWLSETPGRDAVALQQKCQYPCLQP